MKIKPIPKQPEVKPSKKELIKINDPIKKYTLNLVNVFLCFLCGIIGAFSSFVLFPPFPKGLWIVKKGRKAKEAGITISLTKIDPLLLT
jgi:hypothetical protein